MIFNEIAEQGQLSQLLQRRLNMLGAAPAPALMPEIAPCLTLENDRPEWGWLKGENLKSRAIDVAAVVGQHSMCQLYIPSTTRAIAVIESIEARAAVSFNVAHAVGIGGGTTGWTPITAISRDTRNLNRQGDLAILETRQNAALPTFHGVIAQINTGGSRDLREPIVVSPGEAIVIYTISTNVALSINLHWRSRAALPGELG